MTYTQEQKELLLDRLFDGVICLDIYRNVNIRHKKFYYSYYNPKINEFSLSWFQIWRFFETNNSHNYQEIKDLTETILRDLTKRKELTTFLKHRPARHLRDLIKLTELTTHTIQKKSN